VLQEKPKRFCEGREKVAVQMSNKNFIWGLLIGYLVGSFFGVTMLFGAVGAKGKAA
jgi:Na+/H+-translocating membrane pyrophosphatase